MAKSELVYEFQGSRNLNTTPIDITGLQGDTYDYELITFFETEGVNSGVKLTFNNDTTANYRDYFMLGDGGAASATVNDATNELEIECQSFGYPGLSVTYIGGSSGDERYTNSLKTRSSASTDTRIKKGSGYWKNTVNEITSIQLSKTVSVTSDCHILLYRVPKTTSQENWEKVGELSWSAESTTKSFTGLDGDRDKKYKLVWNGDNNFDFIINGDSGANYTEQSLQNQNGTIASVNATTRPDTRLNTRNGYFVINAESGANRLISTTGSKIVSSQQYDQGYWWRNSVDNITSISSSLTLSTTGTATLYRMKSGTKTDGVLDWELIEEVNVSGDFSSGHTFSGLTGDSEKLYKVEYVGEGATSIRLRLNADSGNNYDDQVLTAQLSSVGAAQNLSNNYLSFAAGSDANESKLSELIMYSKSGDDRINLTKQYYDEDGISLRSQWWRNTVDEITSIFAFATSTASMSGTLKLWRLK